MLELYIANKTYSSWSLRPWLLLRELALPFTERLVPFEPDAGRAQFRHFSPGGTVPCLHDGDVVVWESLAIVEYLAERHAGVWPADSRARAWARCAAAEMHAGFQTLRQRCAMHIGVRVRLHEIDEALGRDVRRIEELWNDGLTRFGGPSLAGARFCAVDAFFAPVALRVLTYQLALESNAMAYAQRLLALPGMVEWVDAALRESWRDAAHEADALAGGVLVEDLRITSL